MTFEKVQSLIAEKLGIAKDSITMESRIVEDLGADSLDVVEMLMALEEEFGVVIEDEETENLNTVKSIVEILNNK